MAEQSYPFDAGPGAAMNEAQWQAMARRFRQTGVIVGSLNQLLVSADGSALSVSVASGDAFVEGFFYRNDAALAKTIATAHATNPRIDTVVVRLDRVANTATLQVITGTPAAAPVAPTLSQTDSLYEMPLANVLVPAAAGVIVAGNITGRRTLTQTFDSAVYLAPKSAKAVRTGSNQSIPTSTATAITFTGIVHDNIAAWSAGQPTRITIAESGVYLVSAALQFLPNVTGFRLLRIRADGGTNLQEVRINAVSVAGQPSSLSATSTELLAAGSYLELVAFQDSGGALDAEATVGRPSLSISKIRNT